MSFVVVGHVVGDDEVTCRRRFFNNRVRNLKISTVPKKAKLKETSLLTDPGKNKVCKEVKSELAPGQHVSLFCYVDQCPNNSGKVDLRWKAEPVLVGCDCQRTKCLID